MGGAGALWLYSKFSEASGTELNFQKHLWAGFGTALWGLSW